ncbi:MAG: Ig-like domain-containing protein, partial [Chloroflexi bacterium]|nr:Ig-like domain-containing protein [Chloroflexota bacterium]
VTVGLSSPAGVGGASVTLTASGTATGDDYTLSSTTVAIAEGATAGAATITVIDDAVDDDDETIVLNASLSGSNLTAGPLTLTIADNDDESAAAAPTPVADAGCPVPAGGDYDADDDGLIEICNLAQLVAIDYDLDGDGTPSTSHTSYNAYNIPTRPVYAAAFPGAASGMGCPQTGCIGYELTTDLDFDRNGNGRADANDGYKEAGWIGIGEWGKGHEVGFAAIFEGNGHVIRNLYLYNGSYNGLFHRTLDAAVIRNVGVEDVLLKGGDYYVAGLVGENRGTIINSYTTGQVSGSNGVGGLVGGSYDTSMIIGSYSTATVTGSSDDVGGLVGGNEGTIIASYATGNVTGTGEADDNYVAGSSSGSGHAIGGLVGLNYPDQKIIASYATGTVTAPKGWKVGGLAGFNLGSITASYSVGTVSGTGQLSGLTYSDNSWENDPYARDSYWDTVTSGQATSVQGVGKTTAELQSPTGYAGIYVDWNVDLDGDGSADDPWDFGTSCQYPVLKYGGLNPDDQRAPSPCQAAATPQSQRVYITAHMDDHAAGFDEVAVRSIDLPQGVTMTPAFRSDHYSYELTVPDDTDGLTFAGKFDPEKLYNGCCILQHLAFAVLLAGDMTPADLEAIWLGPRNEGPGLAYPVPNQLIIANSGGRDGQGRSMKGQTNRVELAPDATTVVYLTVYKTPLGDPWAFISHDPREKALKRKVVYTLTVTRGDPSAGDSSGGAKQSAPAVAAPIADVTGLEAGATRDISLSGVFSDADGDSLTITAASSDDARATVSVAADHSKLTVAGVAVGTATITVTAADGNGNRVSDAFEVVVVRKYAALIARVYEWRNDPNGVNNKSHTDRWDRALLAFGETVADTSLTPMTAAEARQMAGKHMASRWNPVAEALAEIEAGGSG